jgi:hypothetical protein
MQASVVIPVPTASIWRPWRGGITPAGRCPASPGLTGHARHVVSVAELGVAAASDDLPVPQHDDLVDLVEAAQARRRFPQVPSRGADR